jgi:DNA-binding protein H-NS
MTTLESMQAKIKKLEQQAEALIAKQSSSVIEKIRKLMAEHGLTAADIEGHAGGKGHAKKAEANTVSKKSASAVKYRDPKSGATWTGHGRAPGWIAIAKNRDRFLVDGATATAKSASAGKVSVAAKKASKLVGQGGLERGSQRGRSRRFIVTLSPGQTGVGADGRRGGWQQ